MRIFDFGAGWRAPHTAHLRAQGLDVTAHDFGRNFTAGVHDPLALSRTYDLVFASNVLNVQCTHRALLATIAQIAIATCTGRAVANYPACPRKYCVDTRGVDRRLRIFFAEVDRIEDEDSAPVWSVAGPDIPQARSYLDGFRFTAEEIAAANVRPAGAVGRSPIVVRIVARMLYVSLPAIQT
jgi:hypothetical protein